jgi:hypothetical protein
MNLETKIRARIRDLEFLHDDKYTIRFDAGLIIGPGESLPSAYGDLVPQRTVTT